MALRAVWGRLLVWNLGVFFLLASPKFDKQKNRDIIVDCMAKAGVIVSWESPRKGDKFSPLMKPLLV
ncbi:MAG: hypothetical protein RMK30_09560 [Anaerolineae bacterium]|nr:hypothetical protein [Anaerolineae bacterium]MDW8103111.1 hypothetical protein [Anaerolineae bacterium]